MKFDKLLASLLILSLGSLALQPALAQNNIELPDIGDSTGTLMTPQQERELGEAFYRKLHSQLDISQDPEVNDYIQSIGQKLAASSDTPAQTFHFFVVGEPAINAFAGPGGYIGVNSGLILTSEAESELASVLAHEIAHVTQRHLLQTFQAAGRLSLPTAAAMLAAVLLGAKSGQLGQAALIAAQAASLQYQINFTRDNEAEADRVGMQILSKSDFDPRAMPTFFERMQQSTRFAGRQLPEFLLTHPVTVSRISDTRGRAEQFAYRQYPDSFAYQIVRAKLRVQTAANPRSALDYFKAVSGQGTKLQQDVSAYGLALALIANTRARDAKPILQKLMDAYPDQSHFVNALATAELETKSYPRAIQLYETALQRFPDNRALTLNYVRALLTTRKAQQARKLLQEYARRHPPTPEVYNLMAQAYSQLGNDAESHRYVAESYYASGQNRAAILQLRLAKKTAGDNFYLNSVIEERLKQLLAEEEERRKQ
ncbi:M48 family metalloprotease [Methylocaldum sp.]|uniref:beta-barrel assembly-enhancing protease n=1 Tax=Methylocaldum sp. TaxID=1969727 RepID=UPI002D75E917|nr:M48 family metalloprotease [Methylocaldum sp.]HYE36566.1 M48 family metalloprotease [Methylocaldum sp.]